MQEVAFTREHHGHPGFVSRRSDLRITARAAGLDDGPDPSPSGNLHTISLGKESI